MDAFEQLISGMLWQDGYWVQTSVKVNLTKAEKVEIGRPSSPRWEIDIAAYSGKTNTLLAVECKSYIDSKGVQVNEVIDPGRKGDRYKLFNEPILRRVVFNRLATQMIDSGACREGVVVRLALACGKIANDAGRQRLQEHFDANGWTLMDEKWIRSHLQALADAGYENQVSSVVAKLLLKNIPTATKKVKG